MYIDGFVLAVKTARKDDYITAARAASDVFLKLGATRMVETWADETPKGEITGFPRAVRLEPDETVVFSWVEYPDKATRDRVRDQIANDEDLRTMTDPTLTDDARMIFGGFTPILDACA